MYGSVGLIVVV